MSRVAACPCAPVPLVRVRRGPRVRALMVDLLDLVWARCGGVMRGERCPAVFGTKTVFNLPPWTGYTHKRYFHSSGPLHAVVGLVKAERAERLLGPWAGSRLPSGVRSAARAIGDFTETAPDRRGCRVASRRPLQDWRRPQRERAASLGGPPRGPPHPAGGAAWRTLGLRAVPRAC